MVVEGRHPNLEDFHFACWKENGNWRIGKHSSRIIMSRARCYSSIYVMSSPAILEVKQVSGLRSQVSCPSSSDESSPFYTKNFQPGSIIQAAA